MVNDDYTITAYVVAWMSSRYKSECLMHVCLSAIFLGGELYKELIGKGLLLWVTLMRNLMVQLLELCLWS